MQTAEPLLVTPPIVMSAVLGLSMAFIAYGRLFLAPVSWLADRVRRLGIQNRGG